MAKKERPVNVEGGDHDVPHMVLGGMAAVVDTQPMFVPKTLEEQIADLQVQVAVSEQSVKDAEKAWRALARSHVELVHSLADLYLRRDAKMAAEHKAQAKTVEHL